MKLFSIISTVLLMALLCACSAETKIIKRLCYPKAYELRTMANLASAFGDEKKDIFRKMAGEDNLTYLLFATSIPNSDSYLTNRLHQGSRTAEEMAIFISNHHTLLHVEDVEMLGYTDPEGNAYGDDAWAIRRAQAKAELEGMKSGEERVGSAYNILEKAHAKNVDPNRPPIYSGRIFIHPPYGLQAIIDFKMTKDLELISLTIPARKEDEAPYQLYPIMVQDASD